PRCGAGRRSVGVGVAEIVLSVQIIAVIEMVVDLPDDIVRNTDVIQRDRNVFGNKGTARKHAFLWLAGCDSCGDGASRQVEAQRTGGDAVRQQTFDCKRDAVVGSLRNPRCGWCIDETRRSNLVAHPLEVAEVKQFVFSDWSANGRTVLP